MSAAPAAALGIGLRVLATSVDESAAQVIHDVVLGRHDDMDALRRLAEGCDVITFDHEHVPPVHLERLEAMGLAVRPGPSALFHAQDKIHMRTALSDIGVPCPKWRVVSTSDEVRDFAAEAGWPLVLKTSRGGYDGRGVWIVEDESAAADVLASPLSPGAQWLAEERIDFVQELSAQVARSPHGQAVAYPIPENQGSGAVITERPQTRQKYYVDGVEVRILAERVSALGAPVAVLLPLKGISSIAVEGGVFYDPAADAALFEAIRQHLGKHVRLEEMDTQVNDLAFAARAVSLLEELMG
jgi:phosphoribosylaminoimidazole carboxylase (NCAIR synthetase)